MIKRIILMVVLLVVFPGAVPASPAEIEPAWSIQDIVVYPDSAMIRKQSVFPLQKGQTAVRLSGIPSHLVDVSVQTGISGSADVKIVDVRVERTYLAKTNHAKAEDLKNRLENLEELIKAGTNDITVLNTAIDLLKKILPFPQNQKVTPSEIDAHVKFVAKSLSENYEQIAKSEASLKRLREEKSAVERELKNVSAPKNESKSIVVSAVALNEVSKITLVLSYIVSGAGWVPTYDLRADSGAKVTMDCFATLRQSTGEDWTGVTMEISTAKPFVYGVPPELSPWLVDVYQPRPVPQRSLSRRDLEEARPMLMEMEKRSEAPAAAGYAQPEIKAETSSFSFVLPRKVDVPSDNQPHKILMASAMKDAKLSYYGVPKLSRYSYLRADLKNPFPFPLVEGPLNIFLDSRLVGAASVSKTILPEEDMSLSLGIDEGIKMEKKLVRKFTESVGTFTKDTKTTYEYGIDVINGKDRELSLTLNDHVPVSRNEKIKVEIESPAKGEAKISEDGIVTWDLKLARREAKNVKIKFSVSYPKDLRIQGLE